MTSRSPPYLVGYELDENDDIVDGSVVYFADPSPATITVAEAKDWNTTMTFTLTDYNPDKN